VYQQDLPVWMREGTLEAALLEGHEDLEVVGESYRQANLWRMAGGRRRPEAYIRKDVYAMLLAEDGNPHDPNAVSVWIDGLMVGYLPRDQARTLRPGLLAAQEREGKPIALEGVIVGGGMRDDGPGMLGVFLCYDPEDFGLHAPPEARYAGARPRLDHDPADFGARLPPAPRPESPGPRGTEGAMRTGLTEAWLTDAEDDSYDLSWYNELPEADRPAIAKLRQFLAANQDPIDRHFQFAELEVRLYRSRDLYESALTEYDEACIQHDAEMDGICRTFMAKWGKIPLLETYRQMAIRQAKKKDWWACRYWAERGLALYGHHAAREEAVEDLTKRRNRAIAKLETTAAPTPRVSPLESLRVVGPAAPARRTPSPVHPDADLEVLVCHQCGSSFERMRARGRKPLLCPQCRTWVRT
jgi:hypothetical protein